MHHDRKAFKQYAHFPRPTECHFCHPEKYAKKIVAQYDHCYIMENRTFYTHWELRKVINHLMIVPRRHVRTLSELNAEESAEIMVIMGTYEQDGYDIFARSPQSSSRSVAHQHTHLIKAEVKPARGIFFWRKPYILKLFK